LIDESLCFFDVSAQLGGFHPPLAARPAGDMLAFHAG